VVIGVAGVNHYGLTAGGRCAVPKASSYGVATNPSASRSTMCSRQVVSRYALVRAVGQGMFVDLTLVMADSAFAEIWSRRRVFKVKGVDVPVASLKDIVASKAAVGRPKDRLFLATHEDALRQLGRRRRGTPPKSDE